MTFPGKIKEKMPTNGNQFLTPAIGKVENSWIGRHFEVNAIYWLNKQFNKNACTSTTRVTFIRTFFIFHFGLSL